MENQTIKDFKDQREAETLAIHSPEILREALRLSEEREENNKKELEKKFDPLRCSCGSIAKFYSIPQISFRFGSLGEIPKWGGFHIETHAIHSEKLKYELLSNEPDDPCLYNRLPEVVFICCDNQFCKNDNGWIPVRASVFWDLCC